MKLWACAQIIIRGMVAIGMVSVSVAGTAILSVAGTARVPVAMLSANMRSARAFYLMGIWRQERPWTHSRMNWRTWPGTAIDDHCDIHCPHRPLPRATPRMACTEPSRHCRLTPEAPRTHAGPFPSLDRRVVSRYAGGYDQHQGTARRRRLPGRRPRRLSRVGMAPPRPEPGRAPLRPRNRRLPRRRGRRPAGPPSAR